MSSLLDLPAGTSTLRLTTNADGWCKVTLVSRNAEKALGADKLTVIKARLRSAVTELESREVAGEVDGKPVKWVLSLFEEHCTIHAARDGGDLVFLFQDADARIIGRVALGLPEVKAWANLLDG